MVAGVVALAFAALVPGARPQGRAQARCPAAWEAGWQKLADKVDAPVYCPTWMPNPLDAKFGGEYQDIYSVDKDHSYLVSFLAHGDEGSGDVHVNFRGYPGQHNDADLHDGDPATERRRSAARRRASRTTPARRRRTAYRATSTASTRTPTSGTSCWPGSTPARSTR